MAEYSHTYYKLTVGPGLGTGESYQGEVEIDPRLFSPYSPLWVDAMRDLATKANIAILTGKKVVGHPSDDNYDPTTEDLESAEVGKITYGAYKSSLRPLHDVEIIRLK
ncbi:hypothetical protein [Pseudomonas cavernicola]|uniref:hypothetical protein n=1 Tax=Pseudomonas cavernicola TaxID=2320866 RepID=UPI0011C3CE12|nr:hypothetical protein [Pseudomonas cavernicola]